MLSLLCSTLPIRGRVDSVHHVTIRSLGFSNLPMALVSNAVFLTYNSCQFLELGVSLLVWPQWWSFADVSQQGVDFSKKISKIKIIFWFDFHRCSHRPSKIRRHFRNKSNSILKLSKNIFYKKCAPKLVFNVDFFFIEEYQFSRRFFVIVIFGKLKSLNHFVF